MTFKRNLRFIIWTVLWFSMPVILFIVFITRNYSTKGNLYLSETFWDLGLLFWLPSLLTIPGFFLHFRYYQQDKGKLITHFHDYFEITKNGETKKILYEDIIKIEHHYVSWIKIPWSDYYKTKLFHRDGGIISISCLSNESLRGFRFKNKDLVIENFYGHFPW